MTNVYNADEEPGFADSVKAWKDAGWPGGMAEVRAAMSGGGSPPTETEETTDGPAKSFTW